MIAVSCLLIKKLVTMMKMTMKVIAMGADKSNLRQQSGKPKRGEGMSFFSILLTIF